MKKYLYFITLLISINAATQVKAPETDFILKNASVTWQHIYEVPGTSSAEISKLITGKFASYLPEVALSTPVNPIIFSVKNDKPNIKKYGAKEMKTSIVAQLYMKYDAVIDIKDNQYTVTLSKIFLDNKDSTQRKSGDISKFICNTSNLTFKTDEKIAEATRYNHKHFIEKFDVALPSETPEK